MKHKTQTRYKVRVTETVVYDLYVDAWSKAHARQKVCSINDGRHTLSDFSPNGESAPVSFGNVVVKWIEKDVDTNLLSDGVAK